MKILSEPRYNRREIVVSFPAQSGKTSYKLFASMPETLEHDGKTYYKAGCRVSDSTAWYRTRWLP